MSRPATTVDAVDAVLVQVPGGELKRRALVRLIAQQDVSKAIVFANRKRDVSSLNRFLQGMGLNARDIHGDLEQVHRQATLDAFKAGEVDFLVATDVAARGLDISDMPVVINFDVPYNTDGYVHRIGRTGRAGKSGRAFTFATAEEGKSVAAIEKLIGKPIRRLELNGAEAEAPRPRPRRRAARRRRPRGTRRRAPSRSRSPLPSCAEPRPSPRQSCCRAPASAAGWPSPRGPAPRAGAPQPRRPPRPSRRRPRSSRSARTSRASCCARPRSPPRPRPSSADADDLRHDQVRAGPAPTRWPTRRCRRSGRSRRSTRSPASTT